VDATWGSLPAKTRDLVLVAAAAGNHAADYPTAEAGYRWARDNYRSRSGVILANILDLGVLPEEFRQLRAARLLRSLGPPMHGPYCPDCHHRWEAHPQNRGADQCVVCVSDERRGLLTRPVCSIQYDSSPAGDSTTD
jgi:hypothetical protein